MSEFRFHIASLAAVFLALGLGIFVGTAFVGAPAVDRQTRLIKRLEENVSTQLKQASEREKSEEALRGLLPGLVRNKLAGKRVLVVQTGAFPAASEAVADALRLAGAGTVGRVTLPLAAWQAAGDKGDSTNGQADSAGGDLSAPIERLVPVLLNPTESTVRALHDDGLISGETDLTGAFRLIVLVGGANAPEPANKTESTPPSPLTLAQTRDVPLIRALQGANAVVVGCEPLDADLSFVPTYQTAGVSTIDAVDRAAGQIALPFALNGEKGNYGYKRAAERVLPLSLTTPPNATPAPANTASPTPPPVANP